MKQLSKLSLAVAVMAMTVSNSSLAQNGTRNVDADGNWSDTANWLGGIVAGGAGNTADFSAVPITAERTVTLDTSRTIGMLNTGDAGEDNTSGHRPIVHIFPLNVHSIEPCFM